MMLSFKPTAWTDHVLLIYIHICHCNFTRGRAYDGSGLFLSYNAYKVHMNFTMSTSAFIENEAVHGGGGGGLSIHNRMYTTHPSGGFYNFHIESTLFLKNKAVGSAGGGAMINDVISPIHFLKCVFAGNLLVKVVA